MKLTPKLETTFHHVVLLHALKDGPPSLHRALLNDSTSEEELTKKLGDYAAQLHSQMRDSAEGKRSSDDKSGSKGSTFTRAAEMLRQGDSADESKDEPASNDRDANRRQRVGKVFPR